MTRTVLFADPDPQVLRALVTIFGDDAELTVLTASTADGALDLLGAQTIHLVVAERMLIPARDTELLVEVVRTRPELPIVVLTNLESDQHGGLRERIGRDLTILQKPWDQAELRRTVRTHASHGDASPDDDDNDETDPFIRELGLSDKQVRRAKRIQSRMEVQKSLGEVLLELGEITKDDFDRVQANRLSALSLIEVLRESDHVDDQEVEAYRKARQATPDRDDRTLLVDAGLVTEEVYLKALATTQKISYVEPTPRDVDLDLLKRTSLPYLRRLKVLPLSVQNGRLQLVTARELSRSATAELEDIFKAPIDVQYSVGVRIDETFRALEQRSTPAGAPRRVSRLEYRSADGTTLRGDATGQEAVRAFDDLLLRAIQMGGSDIHLEPTADRLRVRVRVDGRMQPLRDLPKDMMARVISRIKVLAGADISERRLHQDGKIQAVTEQGEVDIRMSSYVSVHGENLVLRLLDRNRGLVSLGELGFARKVETLVTDVILPSASGLVVITGPTGSGKTTTLYSLIQHILDPEEVVISAEDPVEYVIEGIVQCNINEKTGPGFVDSLRAMVRQDPDTIIVGEMRDERTVKMAFESALTGHKVFSTFHTENSVSAIIRLLDMGVAPFLVSSTLSAIVAQRLLRRVCPHCARPARPEREELKFLGLRRADLEGIDVSAGRGCDVCKGSGFVGRIGIHEVLVPDDEFRDAVLRRAPTRELEALARQLPQFMTLQEDGFLKAAQQRTSVSELVGHVPRDLNARPLATLREVAGIRKAAPEPAGSVVGAGSNRQ